MSEITLGVLRMPPDLWTNDPMDVAQRHSRYVDAANEIDRLTAEVEELKSLIERMVAAYFEVDPAEMDGLIHDAAKITRSER